MTCNVCGREIHPGEPYIEGKDCYICTKCAESIGRTWAKSVGIEIWEGKEEEKAEEKPLMTPKEIKEHLDRYIIGQESYKKKLSIAIYNHYKRIGKKTEVPLSKNNIIVCGPSGTGKTYAVQKISQLLDVPFAICDATTLTEAGYVGDDVESVLVKLYQMSGCDIEKTQRGIVFIDEIDKIARKGDNPSITRDVSGEGVQQGLLKMIEGSVIGIPPHGGRKHPDQDLVYIDTKDILFICAGAFEGLEKKIGQRLNQQAIGFDKVNKKHLNNSELLSRVTPQDLRAFGLIPEIIGRLPVVTHTEELDEEALVRILKEPEDSLVKQYTELMRLDGCDLKFSDDALLEIAKEALEAKTGARGLRHVMEEVMSDTMFEIPSSGQKEAIFTLEDIQRILRNDERRDT